MGQWEDDPNAEGGTRNAERGTAGRGRATRRAPARDAGYDVPRSHFRVPRFDGPVAGLNARGGVITRLLYCEGALCPSLIWLPLTHPGWALFSHPNAHPHASDRG